MKYLARAVRTSYWRPGDDWLTEVVRRVSRIIQEGDFLVVSEKAISVATGRVYDESAGKPTFPAKLIALGWMRVVWGRILGHVCRLSKVNISRLRQYPQAEGAGHKQLALDQVGLFQALRHGSEGGIDASNLPFSYVSLPLLNAEIEARRIRERVLLDTKKRTTVLVVDSDKTYSLHSLHIGVRRTSVRSIRYLGLFGYVVGRLFKFSPRSTPLAVAGEKLDAETALQVSAVANKVRGSGAGRTAWDAGETFKVKPHEVTWEMLQSVRHTPIVLVRRTAGHQNTD